jgi:hypothetical protein
MMLCNFHSPIRLYGVMLEHEDNFCRFILRQTGSYTGSSVGEG